MAKTKYEDVAPVISQFINLNDIPVKEEVVTRPVQEITKEKVELVIAKPNINPTNLGIEIGLSKGQVMKIRKEYRAAIMFKNMEE